MTFGKTNTVISYVKQNYYLININSLKVGKYVYSDKDFNRIIMMRRQRKYELLVVFHIIYEDGKEGKVIVSENQPVYKLKDDFYKNINLEKSSSSNHSFEMSDCDIVRADKIKVNDYFPTKGKGRCYVKLVDFCKGRPYHILTDNNIIIINKVIFPCIKPYKKRNRKKIKYFKRVLPVTSRSAIACKLNSVFL